MNGAKHTLLIVWHSRTGAARQMAEAAASGANDVAATLGATEKFTLRVLRANEAHADDLLSAEGFIFCAPENLASLSGEMKEFFDRCYYPVLERLNGLPYALLIAAGSDGQGAVRQTEKICTGWRLRSIAAPFIALTHAQSPEAIAAPKQIGPEEQARCKEIGGTLAAMLL